MDNKQSKPDNDPLSLIRVKLNKERVKLWQPPYTLEDGQKGAYPEGMVRRYATELGLDEDVVVSALEQLRKHSLEKLAQRRRLSETGITNMTIKVTGKMTVEKAEFPIEVNLRMKGSELKEEVAKNSGVPENRLKLIGCGRVILDDVTLFEQHIRPESQVMAIVLSDAEAAAQAEESEKRRLAEARKDAEILSNQSWGDENEDDYYLQIADQSGKPINLPMSERKALALAMTLHERGKAAIRRKEYPYALLLLLEADEEFSKCRSNILSAVDNFALLCLDICWCYLCLKSVHHLPDADVRLNKCEECLLRSYGKNLERLQALKGNVANEQTLLMRLHLLQGIVTFHKQEFDRAFTLFQLAERELKELHVDDEKLSQILALGFQATEARLALRNSRGDVDMAVSLIVQRREEKMERKRKEEEERKNKRIAKKLGKTFNGEWLNVDMYNMLLAMGFPMSATVESLKRSNNNVSLAVQLLQENPDLLGMLEAGTSQSSVTDIAIAQVASLGFDPIISEDALRKTGGNVQQAIDLLIMHGGILPLAASASTGSTGSTSSTSSSTSIDSTSITSEPPRKSEEEIKQEKKAFERLRDDIPEDEEAHLDFTLEEEIMFLEEYKIKIAQVRV